MRYLHRTTNRLLTAIVVLGPQGKHIPDNKEQTLKTLRGLRK
jgi:hypothetical protein